MRRLFISYARENKRDVDQLVEHLGLMGYDTWVDFRLRGGQDWWEEILRRIADSDVVIAVVSHASMNSTACRRELDWAEALKRPILPVAVESLPAALPRRFAQRQVNAYSQVDDRPHAALMIQGGLASMTAAPPLPEPLPPPPAAPLSYLTDLVDLITRPENIDYADQHKILQQLGAALRSVDPEERRGGQDILERFASRHDLYADIDRVLNALRPKAEEGSSPPSAIVTQRPLLKPEETPRAKEAQRVWPSAATPHRPEPFSAFPPASSSVSVPDAPRAGANGAKVPLGMILSGVVLLLALLVFGIVYAVVLDDKGSATTARSTPSQAGTATSTKASLPETPDAPTTPPAEGEVADGGLTFSVSKTDTGDTVTSAQGAEATANGTYYVVYLNVTNNGTSPVTFLSKVQRLNAAGSSYSPDDEANFYLNGDAVFEIQPGETVETGLVFDIPTDIVPNSLEVHNGVASGGANLPLP